MKHFLIILFSYCLILNANSYSLNDALSHTYKTNPTLNAAREELKATDEKIMQSLSRWLPTVVAGRSKQFVDQRVFEGSRGVPRNGEGTVDSLKVSQNLFRGGSDVAAMKTAQYSIEQMRSILIAREQETLLKAVDVYMKVLQTQELYSMSLEREKHTQLYLTAISKRFDAGQTTKTDVAQAEASYSAAIAERTRAYSDYKSMCAAFEKITNLEPKNLSVPKKHLNIPNSLEEVTDISLKQNPSLIAIKSKYEATNSSIGTKFGNVLPSLDLEYSITDNSKGGSLVPIDSNPKISKTTVISLNIPLFKGGGDWSEIRETKRHTKQIGYELNNVRNETIEKSIQTWQEAKAAKYVYNARQSEVTAARIAYDGVIAEEKAGLKDVTDVISIRSRYFESIAKFLAARSEYFVKLYSLKAQIGECTAKHLDLKVDIYDPLKNYRSIRWQFIGAYTGD